MAADDPDDLIWEKYLLGRRPDTHYSEDTPSTLLFGDGAGIQAHAVRGDRVQDDEPEENEEETQDPLVFAAGIAVGVLLSVGAAKIAPKVKSWWNELRSRQRRNAAIGDAAHESQALELNAIPVEDFSQAVDRALEDSQTMSSAEAERRLVEILLAAAIIAENMRELSDAQIEAGASLELRAALEKLTVPQLTDSLNRMLSLDSAVLGDETSMVLMQIFGGGHRAADGQYVPLENEKVRLVLRVSPDTA